VDSANRVYVADTLNNRVQVNMDGTAAGWMNFMTGGNQVGFVLRPEGVVLASSQNVFIADTGNNRVQRKGIMTGSQATISGGPGTQAGQFNAVTGMR
ncbi:MAG: 6-bladed beta-propeller, partial [Acidobacteriota bacterium]